MRRRVATIQPVELMPSPDGRTSPAGRAARPTAIPDGPLLVAGALLVVFAGPDGRRFA